MNKHLIKYFNENGIKFPLAWLVRHGLSNGTAHNVLAGKRISWQTAVKISDATMIKKKTAIKPEEIMEFNDDDL